MSTLASPPLPVAVPEPQLIRLTVEEFLARSGGLNAELLAGIVKEQPMPGWDHGMLCQNLAGLLWLFVREADLRSRHEHDSWA